LKIDLFVGHKLYHINLFANAKLVDDVTILVQSGNRRITEVKEMKHHVIAADQLRSWCKSWGSYKMSSLVLYALDLRWLCLIVGRFSSQ